MSISCLILTVDVLLLFFLVEEVVHALAILDIVGNKPDYDCILALLEVIFWEVNSMVSEWVCVFNLSSIHHQLSHFFSSIVAENPV